MCCKVNARIQKVLSEGVQLWQRFLVDERGKIRVGHYRPDTETPLMAFRWRAADGSTLNAGLVALQIFRGARIPYICVIFQCWWVGVRPPIPTTGSAHDVAPIVYVSFLLGHSFAIPSLMYFLGEEERASSFALIVYLLLGSCLCSLSLPCSTLGGS